RFAQPFTHHRVTNGCEGLQKSQSERLQSREMPRLLENNVTSLHERARRLEAAIRSVIRGSDEVVRLGLVAVFARGHLLIEGVPGVGKTTLGQALEVPQPFLVIATQNPVEHHGTYPLPESQMDRFLMRVQMMYPAAESEREILRAQAGAARLNEVSPVLTGDDVIEMQEQVKKVRVDESLVNYTLEIMNKTRQSEQLSLGVSPRGSLMLYRA